jgi:[ribosomal protein S5]-alanine N-acetyltransferase
MSPSRRPSRADLLRRLKDPVVVTRRLALILPDPARVPELVRLFRDREISRWTLHIPFPYRASDARTWLRRAPGRRRKGSDLSLLMVRRSDDVLVGGVGLHGLDSDHDRAELGYWVGRPFRRQGYGSEAARALTAYGFRRLALHRVEARVFPGNSASAGVLRAAGFRREGWLRESVRKAGTFRDEWVYARLAGEPASPRAARSAAGGGRSSVPAK